MSDETREIEKVILEIIGKNTGASMPLIVDAFYKCYASQWPGEGRGRQVVWLMVDRGDLRWSDDHYAFCVNKGKKHDKA